MRNITNTLLLILFSYTVASAQEPALLERFSVDEGLSQSDVTCIYQSKDGIIWVGTQDGLNMYDGYGFTAFKNNPLDSNSLINNYINDIVEGNDGKLYIATRGGISEWDRYNNKFYNINNFNDSLLKNNKEVLKLLHFDNTLWILTEKLLGKQLPDNNFEFYNLKISRNFLRTNKYEISDLIVDIDSNIWIATEDGINIFYPKQKYFYWLHDNGDNTLSDKKIKKLYQDKDKNIWIGTHNGLNKYIRSTNYFKKYYYLRQNKYQKENSINDFFIDSAGIYWIATKQGLKTFDGEQIIDFKSDQLNSITNSITNILCDLSGNIWIGVASVGLYKIVLQETKFNSYTNFPNLNDKSIFGIYVDDKNMWLGGQRLFVLDKKNKEIIINTKLHCLNTIQEAKIYNISKINNNIWLGTNNGIFIVNPDNYEITEFFEFFDIPYMDIFENNRILSIQCDENNNIWLASYIGLIKFSNNDFVIYSHQNNNINSISSNELTKLLLDDDKIWIATYNGLNLFDTITETFKHWTDVSGLPNKYLLDIKKIDDSTLWLSSTSGFFKMNIQTEEFKTFNSFNLGFKNDFFYSIDPDNNNNLWLSSNHGIVKYNILDSSSVTYDLKDGLASVECNINSVFLDKDKTYYVGSTKGVSWCNINKKRKNNLAPKTVVTKIVVQSVNKNKSTIYFPSQDKVYKFDYQDFITIYYVVPEYTFPQANQFQYRIEGINDEWSSEQTEHFINIAGISPGNYTMLIRGANSQHIWNNNYSTFKFEIVPPFWKSTYAYIFYIITFSTLIIIMFLLIYWKIKNDNKMLTERNIVLEELNKQRQLLKNKNRNITDSINYAKKIIDAIQPQEAALKKFIPDNFIFFLPKDIVSGDFYWFTEKNDNIYVAAVDCTGHGIPGAIMSILGIKLIENIANSGVTDPAIFLNILNNEIINSLKKNNNEKYLKDGMDMSLCIIDKNRQQLKFAGAYNSAYIIREQGIIQLKSDRQSVGGDFKLNPFTPISMKIRDDDIIYMFSDGYTDQFGGDKTKKFKFKRFRLLLLEIHKLPFNEQKDKIHKTLNEWKGKNEQVDDILIIGFKPNSFKNRTNNNTKTP